MALRPCPVNKSEAMDMLRSLKAYKLLTGYRGSKPCDIAELADTIVRISEYASANADELSEMDVNPLFVYREGEGCCAVDALIVKYTV